MNFFIYNETTDIYLLKPYIKQLSLITQYIWKRVSSIVDFVTDGKFNTRY